MNAVIENQTAAKPMVERPFVAPDVNIYETPESYLLQAEMPGVTKEGIEITLEGNTLTFVGRRTEATTSGQPLYRESRACNYRRMFELDPAIDAGRITAEMKQGLLTLQLPKAEQVKPRRIVIQ